MEKVGVLTNCKMTDKRQKKINQRAKRKAKSKAFFERVKAKAKPKSAPSSFNKSAWSGVIKQSVNTIDSKVFNKNAWKIGTNDG